MRFTPHPVIALKKTGARLLWPASQGGVVRITLKPADRNRSPDFCLRHHDHRAFYTVQHERHIHSRGHRVSKNLETDPTSERHALGG